MAVGRRSELGIARAIDDVVNRVTNAVLPKLALVGKDLDQSSLETVAMFRRDAVAAAFAI